MMEYWASQQKRMVFNLTHHSTIPLFPRFTVELGVFESPGKEWDEFASRYTDLIFYQAVWSQVLKGGLGGQPLYFCPRDDEWQ
jgi:hypothetical protein